MNHAIDVAVLVGSLRTDSWTLKVARTLIELAPPPLALEIIAIGDLPLYNPDLEQRVPPAWAAFRRRLHDAQAVLFATPEYNRSVPGALKNAIDVGSRPHGESVWEGKPAAVISVSPGALGAFGANHHLRQMFVFLNMPAMPMPEAYVGGANLLFDAAGKLTNDATREFLRKFMQAFADWIGKLAAQPPIISRR